MPFQVVRHDSPDSSVVDRPLPNVTLEIRRGRARHTLRPVVGPVFLIGTASDCDLVLGDDRFPDVHTYLYVRPDEVKLRHLDVAPEVGVNGRIVRETLLQDGDMIRTGAYEFRVLIDPRRPSAFRPQPHLPSEHRPVPATSQVTASFATFAAHALVDDVRSVLAESSDEADSREAS